MTCDEIFFVSLLFVAAISNLLRVSPVHVICAWHAATSQSITRSSWALDFELRPIASGALSGIGVAKMHVMVGELALGRISISTGNGEAG